MAKKLLEKEVEEWFENMDDDLQEAFLELDDIDDVRVHKFIGVSFLVPYLNHVLIRSSRILSN